MAQPSKKSAAGARGGKKTGNKSHAGDKGEEVLQAVILADSFQDRFLPFTAEKPRCLLPLANTPMIEYVLEFLAMNGVQEVFIYCSAHVDQIEAYLTESPRWGFTGQRAATAANAPFQSLELLRVGQATSMGDFLRDLDKRGIIEGDFVLVHGDLVANVALDPILARHRARRAANHDAIMTVVLREAAAEADDSDPDDDGDDGGGESGDHHGRAHGTEPLFVLDAVAGGPTYGRILEYEEMSAAGGGGGSGSDGRQRRRLMVDGEFLGGKHGGDVEVRADLIDCGIDICTPDVLALWSESFDCELPRRNFLHNVLRDWELNGKLIFADIVGDGGAGAGAGAAADTGTAAAGATYATRAASLQLYDAVSRDVLGRWTFPMVPDTNLVAGHSYRKRTSRPAGRVGGGGGLGGAVLAEDGVFISGSAVVSSAVLGQATSIGAGSVVTGSTVGRGCRIGANVRIDNSYLWDGVVVGDNAVVTQSIVASGAVVGRGCVLPAGSLLSFGVVLDEQPSSSLSSASPAPPLVLSLVGADGNRVPDDVAVVGGGGKGAQFVYETDDDDGDGDSNDGNSESDVDYDSDDANTRRRRPFVDVASLQRSLIYSTAHLNLSTSSISSFGFDDDGDDDDDDDDDGGGGGQKDYLSVGGHNGTRSRLSSFASLDRMTSRSSGRVMQGGEGGGADGGNTATGATSATTAATTTTTAAAAAAAAAAADDGMVSGGFGNTFHDDAVTALLEALRDDASNDFESARIEFMGLRLGMDASDGAVRRAVAAAFARRAAELAGSGGSGGGGGGSAAGTAKAATEAAAVLEPARAAERTIKGKQGAAQFVREVGVGGGTTAEQVEFVLALQRTLVGLRIRAEAAGKSGAGSATDGGGSTPTSTTTTTNTSSSTAAAPGTLLAALLQQLYDIDVLEEEGILAWWSDRRAAAGGASGGSGEASMAAARERCRVLVEWLETAEEEDDDDEDGSEDEDDDDDDNDE